MNQKVQLICCQCVGEAFLRSIVSKDGEEATCFYCDEKSHCITIDDLAQHVLGAFDRHFLEADLDDSYSEAQPVSILIAKTAQVGEGVAEDVRTILEDQFFDRRAYKEDRVTPFSLDSHYVARGFHATYWQERWQEMEKTLKSENRFFCRSAGAMLSDIFDKIEDLPTVSSRPIIKSIGPGTDITSIYRARCFQSDESLEKALIRPDLQLGPPSHEDTSAGRMNALGISVFYGSNDPISALSEVRPAVGSQVTVARFDIIRPLRVLDLTALPDLEPLGSIFDPIFAELIERAIFFRTLCNRIKVPVMPDHERFEYVATQAIADYLSSNESLNLDGIIYPAVQSPGEHLNIVLFHKASKVEEITYPRDASVRASLGYDDPEGWYSDYGVEVIVPTNEISLPNVIERQLEPHLFDLWGVDLDMRSTSLRIDCDSIAVHQVKGVKYDTQSFPVLRTFLERNLSKGGYRRLRFGNDGKYNISG